MLLLLWIIDFCLVFCALLPQKSIYLTSNVFFRLIEIVSTDQSNMKAVIVPYVFKSLSDSGLSYLEPLKFAAQNFHINLFANMATANLKNVRYVHQVVSSNPTYSLCEMKMVSKISCLHQSLSTGGSWPTCFGSPYPIL